MLREFADTPQRIPQPSQKTVPQELRRIFAIILLASTVGEMPKASGQEPPRNQRNDSAEKSREEKDEAWTNQTKIQIKELDSDLPGNRENAEKELLKILKIMKRNGYTLPDTVLSPKIARINGKITYDVQLRLERILEQLNNPPTTTQSTEDEPCCGIDPFFGNIQRGRDWLAKKIVELENVLALK